jgi:hypothetical protein
MLPTTPLTPAPPGQQAALGTLLASAVEGVVQAQRRLDADALARVTAYVGTPQGELVLPPLWFTFSEVSLQLELAATLTRVGSRSAAGGGMRLDCRLLDPAAVSLFGYQASSGLKVSLSLAPREAAGAAPPGALAAG